MIRKIFINIDGVVLDVIRTIVRLYNEDHEYYKDFSPINYKTITSWEFKELSLEPLDYITNYMNNPRFFDKVEMIDSARWIIGRLFELQDYDIVFYSKGSYPNNILKKIWVLKYFPYVDFVYEDELIDMENCYCIDIISDNLRKCNAATKICFGNIFDKNTDWDGIRLETWSDIYEYIKTKEEEQY